MEAYRVRSVQFPELPSAWPTPLGAGSIPAFPSAHNGTYLEPRP